MLFVGDALAVVSAVVLALWTWSLTAGFPFGGTFLRARAVWFLCVPLWLAVLMPTRESRVAFDLRHSAAGIARAAGALLLVYLAAFFWAGGARLPRLVAIYLLWDATLLLCAWRLVAQWSFTRAPFSRRILLAGSGRPLDVARELARSASFRDAEIVGVVKDANTDRLDDVAARLQVTDVIVAMEGDADDQWVQQLLKCQEQGRHVVRMAQLYEETLRRVPVEHVEPSWLLTSFFDVARFRDSSPLAKRCLDLIVAGGLAVIGLLISPVLALAVLADAGPPVLYRQRRLGRGGRPFQITKFRTMGTDAESDGAAKWSTPGDPRVTRVGRLLRRARLDEFPNLWAVLRGDMSMVGPRPERPEFVEQLEKQIPFYRARLIVRPGLTGWAQVNSPYGDSVHDATVKLEYDLYYIKHQSIWFDTLILLRTVGTMLRLGGQ